MMKHTFATGVLLLAINNSMVLATGIKPEIPTVILDAQKQGGSVLVKNTDNHPVLLYTKIVSLEDDPFPAVYVVNPVVRMEANGMERVNFVIAKGNGSNTNNLSHIKRVVFESIAEISPLSRNIGLTVSQNLPLIIMPDSNAVPQLDWGELEWIKKKDNIIIKNNSKNVFRMLPNIKLMPSGENVNLRKTYILPGELINLNIKKNKIINDSTILFYPVTQYGMYAGQKVATITLQ